MPIYKRGNLAQSKSWITESTARFWRQQHRGVIKWLAWATSLAVLTVVIHSTEKEKTWLETIVGNIESISIFGAGILYVLEASDRQQQRRLDAWERIHPDVGRFHALEYLNNDGDSLKEITLVKANLEGIDLSGADLRKAAIKSSNLKNAILINADLSGADLSQTDLTDADLRGANLSSANLSRAKLNGTNFKNATLAHTRLSDATLLRANLERADLRNSELENADLRHANLKDADLNGANLEGAKGEKAILEGATMPDASDYQSKDQWNLLGGR